MVAVIHACSGFVSFWLHFSFPSLCHMLMEVDRWSVRQAPKLEGILFHLFKPTNN